MSNLDFCMAESSEWELERECARSMYRFFKTVNVFHMYDGLSHVRCGTLVLDTLLLRVDCRCGKSRTDYRRRPQPVRVICSFLLSVLLVYPSLGQSPAQPTQESKGQQPAQKPETVSLKQPLAFGPEDCTPINLRRTTTLPSADATTGDRVDFAVLEDVKVKDAIDIPRSRAA